MLIETSGSRADHDEQKLNTFLKYAMENGLVLDGTVTNDPGKIKVRKVLYSFEVTPNFFGVTFDILFLNGFWVSFISLVPRT